MSADDRLSVVTAAIAEREHLVRVRGLLAEDIAAEEKRVQQLSIELRYEQADVERLTVGVMGFIESILRDQGALEKEKREVAEAQARLREAQGSLDMLRQQARGVDARIAQLVPADLERELAAARTAKEESLVRSGTTAGAELQDIAIRIESIDIELLPLGDAVAAGEVAFRAVGEILAVLDAAATKTFDLGEKRVKALAGEAQAKISIFHRALGEVATASFGEPLTAIPGDTTFVDDWIKALFSKRTPQERLVTARASMVERIERINAVMTPLRTRRDEIAARRLALVNERTRLVG